MRFILGLPSNDTEKLDRFCRFPARATTSLALSFSFPYLLLPTREMQPNLNHTKEDFISI